MKRGLDWGADDSHHISISERVDGGVVEVTDITLSKTTVALGEAFNAHVFISNTTGGTVNKVIVAFFGNYDPETGACPDCWGWGGPGDIPLGNSEWIIPCTGNEVGTWDVLGCIGYASDSVFTPEHCAYYLDMLTVY